MNFWMQTFFPNLTIWKVFTSESNALEEFFSKSTALQIFYFKIRGVVFFQFKIWNVVNFLFQTDALWSLWFKIWFFLCFSGPSTITANVKEESEEFATCLCMIFLEACLYAFCVILGLMMAVMTTSFALPFHIFSFFLASKKWQALKN